MKTAAIAIRQIKRYTGAVRNVIEHAHYLSSQGYHVTILAEKKNDAILRSTGAKFVRIVKWPLKGYFRRVWFDRRVQRWLAKHPVDVFFSHGDCHSNDILVMHNCVRLQEDLTGKNPSNVASLHDSVIADKSYRALIANSELMKLDFVRRYGVPEENVHVVYPGVDTKFFNDSDHDRKRQAGREGLGVSPQETLIGLITSGDFNKRNLSFFIDIANELIKSRAVDWRFLVVGKSDPTAYKEKVDKLGIANHFTFMSPIRQVDHLFHALDLHVFPAKMEEFGRVVLEALACGTPSIVSSQVGASELMRAQNLPTVLKDYDAKKWSDIVFHTLQNREEWARLRVQSAEAGKKYSMEEQSKSLEALLDELI